MKTNPLSREAHLSILLLLGLELGVGCALFAQNGMTISNLTVDAGTVTFNVSWNKDAMPALWLDSAWVFVDYNNKGVMMRLPLSPGATLTATSPGGKVIAAQGNNQGVWVVGNARQEGSFSATVKLLSTVTNIGGACAYASSYPPVGRYTSATKIAFTGTPPFELTFDSGDEPVTLQWKTPPYTYIYTVPDETTLLSFTDKTGAPGKFIFYCAAGVIGGEEDEN
jgi:hypothetical protein